MPEKKVREARVYASSCAPGLQQVPLPINVRQRDTVVLLPHIMPQVHLILTIAWPKRSYASSFGLGFLVRAAS